MKEVTLKTLEQTDNVSLYSICFDGNALSEYEAFVQKFKDDATLNIDYKKIILALEKIVAVGAFERFFRPEGNGLFFPERDLIPAAEVVIRRLTDLHLFPGLQRGGFFR